MNKEDSIKEKFKQALQSTYKVISDDYKVVKNKKNEELVRILTANDIPHGQVNTLESLKENLHLKETNFFRSFKHPTEGELVIPDTGIK